MPGQLENQYSSNHAIHFGDETICSVLNMGILRERFGREKAVIDLSLTSKEHFERCYRGR